MNEEIEKIFQGKITINEKDIPVSFMEYVGDSEDYVVYYNDGNTPCYYSDDDVVYSNNELEFNVYTKGNYLKIVEKIKEIMKKNGYNWLGDNGDLYETDTKYHHFVITFDKLRRI